MLKGFEKGFNNTKIATDSVKTGTVGNIGLTAKGNTGKQNIPFKSGTKAATPATKI